MGDREEPAQNGRTGHGRPRCWELREPEPAPSSASQQPEPPTQPQSPPPPMEHGPLSSCQDTARSWHTTDSRETVTLVTAGQWSLGCYESTREEHEAVDSSQALSGLALSPFCSLGRSLPICKVGVTA